MNIDWIITGKAAILGLVQGLTELLPVSSTGHLVLAEHWLDVTDEKWKAFDVFVHMGTLLAICAAYYQRLERGAVALLRGDRKEWRFWSLIVVAAIPALAAGAALNRLTDEYLRKPVPVACALIVGAFAIFAIERWYRNRQARGVEASTTSMETVTPLHKVPASILKV